LYFHFCRKTRLYVIWKLDLVGASHFFLKFLS
jgi:hypothetical protein